MTHDDTGDGTARGTSPLLRHVNGIELPVAGTWNVPGSRSVAGPHRWALSGEVFPETGVSRLRATLGYHGVWRRGEGGWFVLASTNGLPADAARWRLWFSFDLPANGPQTESRPATARSRSLSIRAASQTIGAA
jgi:hypothetical protein